METKHLILRTLTKKDAWDMYEHIHHDQEVLKTFLAQYAPSFDSFDFDRILTYFERNKLFYYGIELKENHRCIGLIFDNASSEDGIEIGYALSSAYWNRGYGQESLQAVVDELGKKGYKRIYAAAFKENKASLRIMEKCGMRYSHTVEAEIEWQGKKHDVVYYEKTD